ncbi:phage holin family protein [Roseivirga pacifica]|uniref:phage holin family protein n=1 Tax=Roseivirga pacifica TaxID=1267423 RepID=UPI002094371F|nr:phage holin family protein [Roseivirga pacifica]
MIKELVQQVGFDSLNDLFSSTFALKLKLGGLYLYGAVLSGFILALEHFTETVIYKPALGIAILLCINVADTIFGVSVAISNKLGIDVPKLSRAVIRFFTQCFFVGIAYQMSQAWGYVISYWMVDFLLIYFVFTVFISGLKNARALNLITQEQYLLIESIFNIKSFIQKFKSKDHESNH